YLGDQKKDHVGEVLFLGFEPDIVRFYYPMTPPVKEAVEGVYSRLAWLVGYGGFSQNLAVPCGGFALPGLPNPSPSPCG
ncbi:hypothetical protein ACVGWW_00340, partial [Enterobacter hormaechei]